MDKTNRLYWNVLFIQMNTDNNIILIIICLYTMISLYIYKTRNNKFILNEEII